MICHNKTKEEGKEISNRLNKTGYPVLLSFPFTRKNVATHGYKAPRS